MRTWGFLTNHAHVLLQIARNPRAKVREIALATGITERATHAVLEDLRSAGIARTYRDGRQNVNQVDAKVLVEHRPWAASDMEIPKALIDATVRGLSSVATTNGPAHEKSSAGSPSRPGAGATRRWGFLTTHAVILIHVTQHPRSTVREIATAAGITERAAHAALQDLREAGIIDRHHEGRRNRYTVNLERLATFRRMGTGLDVVPAAFVSHLLEALLPLRPAEAATIATQP